MSDPLDDWDYPLPDDRIARYPADKRDQSRLMHVDPRGGTPTDHRFADLPDLLEPGDVLVANDTRVMAARLRAHRASGGAVELLLLGPGPGRIPAMARPAKRLKDGEVLQLLGGGTLRVWRTGSLVEVEFDRDPIEVMAEQGEMPLPPYLGRLPEASDAERYQTVYAGNLGAAAAPTAGLHFTPDLLETLAARGIGWATVTLHVGIATFRPLRPEDLDRGRLHNEHYDVPAATAQAIAAARAAGGRVIAVGTTTARTLEAATPEGGSAPLPGPGDTEIFLRPPRRLHGFDGLITNFHLPRSSLLMLVACLVGRQRLLATYAEAVSRGYRFYSYGDAMVIL